MIYSQNNNKQTTKMVTNLSLHMNGELNRSEFWFIWKYIGIVCKHLQVMRIFFLIKWHLGLAIQFFKKNPFPHSQRISQFIKKIPIFLKIIFTLKLMIFVCHCIFGLFFIFFIILSRRQMVFLQIGIKFESFWAMATIYLFESGISNSR